MITKEAASMSNLNPLAGKYVSEPDVASDRFRYKFPNFLKLMFVEH